METQGPSGRAGSDADVTSDREIGLYYVCGFCSKFEFAKFLAENCAKMIEFEMDFNGCYDGVQLLHNGRLDDYPDFYNVYEAEINS